MKIGEIRGYRVECALPRPVRNATGLLEKRSALVVELIGDTGHSGWGECSQFPASVWSHLETALAGQVLGRDPRMTGRIHHDMGFPRPGGDIAMMAISAIDMALWDLRGRIEGVPVSTLLGGRLRDRVLSYASGPFMKPGADPFDGFVGEAEAYARAGFRALKARCGAAPRRDAAMAAALRRELGDDILLMVDVNRGYSRPAALEAMRRLEDAGLLWIEEPIAADDFDGYRALARRGGPPLAGGEALSRLPQFKAFLGLDAVSVLQPDLYRCGGFTGAAKVAALAEAAGVAYVPHVWGTAINFHASLQLVSTLPGARLSDGAELPLFEWDRSDNALLAVAGEPSVGSDGSVAIPTGPGIGIELDRGMFEPFVRQAWRVST